MAAYMASAHGEAFARRVRISGGRSITVVAWQICMEGGGVPICGSGPRPCSRKSVSILPVAAYPRNGRNYRIRPVHRKLRVNCGEWSPVP